MKRRRLGRERVEFAVATTTPRAVVARYQLLIRAAIGNADAILLARQRGEIQNDYRMAVAVASYERNNRVRPICHVHPAEPFPAGILGPERRLVTIHVAEAAHVI